MSGSKLHIPVNGLLVVVLLSTVWTVATAGWYPLGIDAMQFYGAADLVNRGESNRLYDQAHFQTLQQPLAQGEDCSHHYSFYPPIVALLLTPWAKLPYSEARVVWWVAEALFFAFAGWMIHRWVGIPRPWRLSAVLAVAILMPVWMAMRVGQMTPVWLVAILGGFLLHQRGRRFAAGLALSVLAMKPQLALPLGMWLAMRRDWRALGGMFAGAAVQNLLVMACLGPAMPFYYLRELPNIMRDAKMADHTAAYEQSIAGTVKNLLMASGWLMPEQRWTAMLIQPVLALAAGMGLYQVVRGSRRLEALGSSEAGAIARNYEYASAVLFVVLTTPHLLLYDAAILAAAIAYLLKTPAWRLGAALVASLTTAAALAYYAFGFSAMPILAMVIVFQLAARVSGLENESAGQKAQPAGSGLNWGLS